MISKTRPTVNKVGRQHLYIRLQMHPGYDRLTDQQKTVIDCFAAGMNYEETGKSMGNQRSAPYSMLKTILRRYKPMIWKQTQSLTVALTTIAKEVKL